MLVLVLAQEMATGKFDLRGTPQNSSRWTLLGRYGIFTDTLVFSNQAGNGSGNGNSAGNGNGSGNGSGNHVNLCAPLSLDPNIT